MLGMSIPRVPSLLSRLSIGLALADIAPVMVLDDLLTAYADGKNAGALRGELDAVKADRDDAWRQRASLARRLTGEITERVESEARAQRGLATLRKTFEARIVAAEQGKTGASARDLAHAQAKCSGLQRGHDIERAAHAVTRATLRECMLANTAELQRADTMIGELRTKLAAAEERIATMTTPAKVAALESVAAEPVKTSEVCAWCLGACDGSATLDSEFVGPELALCQEHVRAEAPPTMRDLWDRVAIRAASCTARRAVANPLSVPCATCFANVDELCPVRHDMLPAE